MGARIVLSPLQVIFIVPLPSSYLPPSSCRGLVTERDFSDWHHVAQAADVVLSLWILDQAAIRAVSESKPKRWATLDHGAFMDEAVQTQRCADIVAG